MPDSAALARALPAFASLYESAVRTVSTPVASLNVTTYDRVPEQPGMPAASAAPVPGVGPYPLGWASLTHRDAEYGPLRPNSTGVEFEEILRLVDDADTLAALRAALNHLEDVHTQGYQPLPSTRRRLDDPHGLLGGVDHRYEIACSTAARFPFSALVDLASTSAESITHCSGTLISSDWVLTAGHCLYDDVKRTWMVPTSITPNACEGLGGINGRRPSYSLEAMHVHATWRQCGSACGWQHDLGLLKLRPLSDPLSGRPVHAGDVNGFLSMSTSTSAHHDAIASFDGGIYGYPALVNGQWQLHNLWGMRGSLTPVENAPERIQQGAGPNTLVTDDIDVTAGTSGSATLRALGSNDFDADGIGIAGVAVAGGLYPLFPFNIVAKFSPSALGLIRTVAPATSNARVEGFDPTGGQSFAPICPNRGTACPDHLFVRSCASLGLPLKCYNAATTEQCCEAPELPPPSPMPAPPAPPAPPQPPPPYDVCGSFGPGLYKLDKWAGVWDSEWQPLCGSAGAATHCAGEEVDGGKAKHVVACGMWNVAAGAGVITVHEASRWLPVFARVKAGAELIFEVFDSAAAVADGLEVRAPLVPTLVAHAEAGSRVDVRLHRTANVEVRQRLDVAFNAALIDRLVIMDEGAAVDVLLADSANVLADTTAQLSWDSSALVRTLVSVATAMPAVTAAPPTTRVSANATRIGNVRLTRAPAAAGGEGLLTLINNATLLEPLVDVSAADADVSVSSSEIAGVEAAEARLVLRESYLLGGHVRVAFHPPVDTGACARASVAVRSAEAARVTAVSLDMEQSSVIEESIDLKVIDDVCTDSTLSAHLSDVADVTLTEYLYLQGSQLMDETVDIDVHSHSTGAGLRADVDVRLERAANVVACSAASGPCELKVFNSSELIDETFDLQFPEQLDPSNACGSPACCMRIELNVSVRVDDSGNLQTSGPIDFFSGELIDETLDMSGCFGHGSLVDAHSSVTGSANVIAEMVTIFDGDIMDELIDIDMNTTGGVWTLGAVLTNTASITAANLSICEGELVDEIFDLSGEVSNTTWHLHGVIDHLANVQLTDGLAIKQGELIDETFDVSFRFQGTANISMTNSANVHAGRVHILGQLLDEFIDVLALELSTIFVHIANVANVDAGSLLIEDGELIDEALDIEEDLDRTFIQLIVEQSANVRARHATVLGALVDPLFDAGNMISSTTHVYIREVANLVADEAFEINPRIDTIECHDHDHDAITRRPCRDAYTALMTLANVADPQPPCIAAPVLLLDTVRQSSAWEDDPASAETIYCMLGHQASGVITTITPTPHQAVDVWTAPLMQAMDLSYSRLGLSVDSSMNVQAATLTFVNYTVDNTTNVTCPTDPGPFPNWVPSWSLPSQTSTQMVY